MDALIRKTSDIKADGKIVWSRHPDAGVKFSRAIRKTTGANKPGTPAIRFTHFSTSEWCHI
jgi:hypothetical protein